MIGCGDANAITAYSLWADVTWGVIDARMPMNKLAFAANIIWLSALADDRCLFRCQRRKCGLAAHEYGA